MYIFTINIVSSIAACFGNMSNVRRVEAVELKVIDKNNQRWESSE